MRHKFKLAWVSFEEDAQLYGIEMDFNQKTYRGAPYRLQRDIKFWFSGIFVFKLW